MNLDIGTVLFTGLLVTLVVTLFSWALAGDSRTSPWRRDWALGNTGLLVGVALLLSQGRWTPWISVVLANVLILGGYFLLGTGVRRFVGRPQSRWFAAVFFALLGGGFLFFTFVVDNFRVRTVLHSLLAIAVCLRIVAYLATDLVEERRRNPVLVNGFVGVFSGIALFYAARAVAVNLEAANSVLAPSASFPVLFLFLLIAMVSWTLGFIALDLLRNQRLLKASVAARDRLFTIIAHDLKGPIGSVAALLDLMRQEATCDENYRENLDLTAESSRESFALLENLLTWAQSQKGESPNRPTALDVDALVAGVLAPLRLQARSKDLRLSVPATTGLKIWGDEPAVATVLRNLTSNAIKFTPRGGKVEVDVSRSGEQVLFTVKDSGPGLPASVLRALNNGDMPVSTPGSEGEKGTGLGLLVCRDFVKDNQGSLEFSSSQGTLVSLRFPRA